MNLVIAKLSKTALPLLLKRKFIKHELDYFEIDTLPGNFSW